MRHPDFAFPPSPIQRLHHPAAELAGIAWYVKRDDLYGPAGDALPFQGNKVRKLRGVLEAWLAAGDPDLKIISFGGAFSNHLIALATAGHRYGIPTVGIVRGEAVSNPVLDGCRAAGMELHFVSRPDYRRKHEAEQKTHYLDKFGPALLVPEGGSGPLSLVGTQSILAEITGQLPPSNFDHLQLAAGTGGTAAGMISGPQTSRISVEVFPVLKGNWMAEEIRRQLPTGKVFAQWEIIDGYHWGGYAKRPPALTSFCTSFYRDHQIPVEPIYTGKLFYGVLDRIKKGYYPRGSRLVTYHSGGIF